MSTGNHSTPGAASRLGTDLSVDEEAFLRQEQQRRYGPLPPAPSSAPPYRHDDPQHLHRPLPPPRHSAATSQEQQHLPFQREPSRIHGTGASYHFNEGQGFGQTRPRAPAAHFAAATMGDAYAYRAPPMTSEFQGSRRERPPTADPTAADLNALYSSDDHLSNHPPAGYPAGGQGLGWVSGGLDAYYNNEEVYYDHGQVGGGREIDDLYGSNSLHGGPQRETNTGPVFNRIGNPRHPPLLNREPTPHGHPGGPPASTGHTSPPPPPALARGLRSDPPAMQPAGHRGTQPPAAAPYHMLPRPSPGIDSVPRVGMGGVARLNAQRSATVGQPATMLLAPAALQNVVLDNPRPREPSRPARVSMRPRPLSDGI